MTRPIQQPLAVQPVEKPILCKPYFEPTAHWVYDLHTGIPHKMDGRRPANYWFKTERTGSAQQVLPGMGVAQEESDDLPLVNALREDVRRWHDAKWENASETTKALLRHWWNPQRPGRRLFFCQLEAVETVIYIQELLARGKTIRGKPNLTLADYAALCAGKNPRPQQWLAKVAQHPKLVDLPHDTAFKPLTRYACKMATGSGKTVVMAMLIVWTFANRGRTPGDPRFPRHALVVCPNLTIKERLQVLRPENPQNYYEAFDLLPNSDLLAELKKGKIRVTNWHDFNAEAETLKVGGVTVARLGPETADSFARSRLGDLYDGEPIMVLNDEGHHAYRPAKAPEHLTPAERRELEEATVWVDGLDKINAAAGIAFCVDLSATPFYIGGSGFLEGSPFPWIVSDFGLVDAIESGITKIPRLPVLTESGKANPEFFRLWEHIVASLQPGEKLAGGKPKPEAVFRHAAGALTILAGQWNEKLEKRLADFPGQDVEPPVMIIVCDNTDIAEEFHRRISGEEVVEVELEDDTEDDGDIPKKTHKPKMMKRYGAGLLGFPELANQSGAEVTIRIDSELLADAESEDPNAKKRDVAESLRKIVSTVGKRGEPGRHVRCVVSVNMLSEGWDANNVTHILGLRAFNSQLLCEQVVGRGLRRMNYEPDPTTGMLQEEYVDIFGVPFSLIPFKGREPGRSQGGDERDSKDVFAMDERAALEIRFPVVEGYVVSLRRNLVRCEVDKVEPLRLDALLTPTGAFVRPQVGYQIGWPGAFGGFQTELLDREAYYVSVHPQTIAFEIAREIVRTITATVHDKEKLRLQSRAALFPQVLRITQQYIASRVRFNGLHPCEIGLQEYSQKIVSLLAVAIDADDAQGESPLLPRLNRYKPIGSTKQVRFKTAKQVMATTASHLNYVASDTTWEQAAVFQLEKLALDGRVMCYVRNDRLEFSIPYDFHGVPRAYEPDFVVRLKNGTTLVLEIKGQQRADTDSKHEAAKRWVRAVNHWGQLGQWDFMVCREPEQLGGRIAAIADRA